jgi:hypothetical protein
MFLRALCFATLFAGPLQAHDTGPHAWASSDIETMVETILSAPQIAPLETPEVWNLDALLYAFDWPQGTDRFFLQSLLDAFGLYVKEEVSIDGHLIDPDAIYGTDLFPAPYNIEAIAPQAAKLLRWYEEAKTCCD